MPALTLDYTPSPTIRRFIMSTAFYNVCCSSRGGGKTTGALMRTIVHAMDHEERYRPLKWACVRDTRKNLGLTTARTIREWCPEPYAHWRGKAEEPESCTIYIKSKPVVTFDFFGVNSPADLDRFQSYEASGGIWIEEPAPAATNTEYISSGIAESVLAMAVTSVRGAPWPSIQITMNPPSADHWTAQLWQLPGYEAMGEIEEEMPEDQRRAREDIRSQSAVFMVPPTENAAEKKTPGYTERNRQILLATGRTDMLARLVEGRIGYAQIGERVTPEFNASHIAHGMHVLAHTPIQFFYDFGLSPTCIATQISPQGYWLIYKVFQAQNVGMKQLIQQQIQPWLASHPEITHWSHGGGPEAVEREQSNSEESAMRTIIQLLGGAYRAGPVSWAARRDAVHDALTRTPGGIPWVRVDAKGAALLVRCLDGGWAYPVDNAGHVRREKPDKRNRFDHIGDAFAHGCALLLKKTDREARQVPHAKAPTRFVPRREYAHYRGSRTGA